MKKNASFWVLAAILFTITWVVFFFGVFNNPHFDIHDFCMGLATEILGVAIVALVIERYGAARVARYKKRLEEKESKKEKTGR